MGGVKSRSLPVFIVMLISSGIGSLLLISYVLVVNRPFSWHPDFLFAMASGVVGVMGMVCFYTAAKIGTLSIIAPISGTAAVVPIVYGLAVGEVPSNPQWVGMCIALAGLIFISFESSGEELIEGKRQKKVAPGVFLAFLSALGFGLFFVLMSKAAKVDPLWAVVFGRGTAWLLAFAVVLFKKPSFSKAGSHWRGFVAMGFMNALASVSFSLATTKELVGIVSVIVSLDPVIIIALAMLLLGERPAQIQLMGVVMALVGVGLISA